MANNGKSDFVVVDEPCAVDDDNLLVEVPETWRFVDHNPLKRDQFASDLDEVFLDYKAELNRQKAAGFVVKADQYAAQAAALLACGNAQERATMKVTIAAENKLAERYGLTPEQIREALSGLVSAD